MDEIPNSFHANLSFPCVNVLCRVILAIFGIIILLATLYDALVVNANKDPNDKTSVAYYANGDAKGSSAEPSVTVVSVQDGDMTETSVEAPNNAATQEQPPTQPQQEQSKMDDAESISLAKYFD